MKKILLFGMFAVAVFSAKSQELLFKITQGGAAYRDGVTGKFSSAEVTNIEGTIFLKKNKLVVAADTKATYAVIAKEPASKINSKVIVYSYNGRDEKNVAVSLICTLNINSKEAIIEVGNDKIKNYYFGTYSSSDLSARPNTFY